MDTHPLDLLETLVVQKCLVPNDRFQYNDGWMPGMWAKCVLMNESFAVCQVYPRHDIESCYLDNCVATKSFDTGNLQLKRLEKLFMIKKSVSAVKVILTLKTNILRKSSLSRSSLQDMVKLCLQALTLVPNTSVQHELLRNFGVASVEIIEAEGCMAKQCFMIDTKSVLHIVDVRLQQPETQSAMPYHVCGFENQLQELSDLIQIACNPRRLKGLPLNALLTGAAGSGKSSLVQQFILLNHCNCFKVTASMVLGQYAGETEVELRKIFRSACTFNEKLRPSSPTIILLEDLHLLCPAVKLGASDGANAHRISAQLLSLVDELRLSNINIVCIGITNSLELLNEQARRAGRFEREITINAPTEAQRRQLFQLMFSNQFPSLDLNEELIEAVAKQTQGYVVADLELLVRSIAQIMLLTTDESLNVVVSRTLQLSQPTAIRSTDVTVYKTSEGFESIGGMDELKRTLEVSVLAGLQHSTAFSRFGLTLPKGVLLYGPPGCAKTTIAKCLAKEANMTFIATSGAEVYSPYVGCAERFISKIFDTARKNAPCLIFLDEIDSLVGRRSLTSNGGDVQLRILSTLLTEMDGIVASGGWQEHIFVVAATNRPDMIDDALMRPGRFDKLIYVTAPDLGSRQALLELHAQRMPFMDNVDLADIAERTANYSGADLCNLCNEAAMHAFQRDVNVLQIDSADFEAVLCQQKSSLTQRQIDFYSNFATKFI